MNNSINELLIKIFSEAVEAYNITEMKNYLNFSDDSYNEKDESNILLDFIGSNDDVLKDIGILLMQVLEENSNKESILNRIIKNIKK